jgi:hypothetical protein
LDTPGGTDFGAFFTKNTITKIAFNLPPKMSFRMLEQGLIEQFEDEKKEGNHVQTQNPIPSNIGQYELEVQFLANLMIPPFFGG